MTITTQQSYVTYSGDGLTQNFPFVFPIPNDSSLLVVLTTGGISTTLSKSLYSTTGLGTPDGGVVTYAPAPLLPVGTDLTIMRVLPIAQLTSLINQGGYYPRAVEQAFDYVTELIQQLNTTLLALQADAGLPPLIPPSGLSLETIADLRVRTGIAASDVLVIEGYYASADGGGGVFVLDETDVTTADNGVTVFVDAAGLRWKRQYARGQINARWGGAKGDGAFNDQPRLAACAAVCVTEKASLYLPGGRYRVAATFAVPVGVLLEGEGIISPVQGTTTGTVIVGDLAVTPVVKLGNATLTGLAASGITVLRAAGVPSTVSQGLMVDGGQGVILEDVFSFGHGEPFRLNGQAGGLNTGLGWFLNRCFSGGAYGSHVVLDTVPEVRFNQCRLGVNGFGDQNCHAYVKVTGGIAAAAGGPNTIIFDNTQFNQGQNSVDHVVSLVGLVYPGDDVSFAPTFIGGSHVEPVAVSVLHTDASWVNLSRVGAVGATFNCPDADFFDLNAATAINEMRISGSFIGCATFAPNVDTVNGLVLGANVFTAGCEVTLDSGTVGNWTVSSLGNTFQDGAKQVVKGDRWFGRSVFMDSFNVGCTSDFSGIGPNTVKNVSVATPGATWLAWTPRLNFGGAHVGTVYDGAFTAGALQVIGGRVFMEFRIKLTNKGTSVGAATVTGFPITQSPGSFQTGAGGVCFCDNGMVGLPLNAVLAKGPVAAAPGEIELVQQIDTGTAPITNANFSNTSDIAASLEYFL